MTPVQYYTVLKDEGLLSDASRVSPELFAASVEMALFYEISAGRRHVGLVVISNIVPGHTCDLHIVIDRQFRRFMRPRGRVGKVKLRSHSRGKLAAADEIFRICFEGLGVRRVSGGVPYTRKAANRLNRRMGMTREGVLRDAVSYDGKAEDVVVWGMTRKDYDRIMETRRMADYGRRSSDSDRSGTVGAGGAQCVPGAGRACGAA